MRRNPGSFHRHLAVGAIAALAVVTAVSCGSDEQPQSLSFKVEADGNRSVISVPRTAAAGLTEIKLGNNSRGEADLQLVKVEGDRSAKEVAEGFRKATEGKPIPDWLRAAGGFGLTQPGGIVSVTQILQPGTYYAFNTVGPIDPKTAPTIEITGESADEELPEAAGTVKAREYAFDSKGLPSGTVAIHFDNVGDEPHHMIASKLIGDKTAEDVERFFKTNKGAPPVSENDVQSTGVLEGGESQLVTFRLDPGRYAFYCFISDREGGPPHVAKGMVDEIEVKEPKGD